MRTLEQPSEVEFNCRRRRPLASGRNGRVGGQGTRRVSVDAAAYSRVGIGACGRRRKWHDGRDTGCMTRLEQPRRCAGCWVLVCRRSLEIGCVFARRQTDDGGGGPGPGSRGGANGGANGGALRQDVVMVVVWQVDYSVQTRRSHARSCLRSGGMFVPRRASAKMFRPRPAVVK